MTGSAACWVVDTLKSCHHLDLSTSIPFESNLTPSPSRSFSFFSQLIPLGAFCQSPWNPPMYYMPDSPYQHGVHKGGEFVCWDGKCASLTPVLAMHRWHGTSGANGLFLNAPPTARGELSSALAMAA